MIGTRALASAALASLVVAAGLAAPAAGKPRAFDATRSSGIGGIAHTWGGAVADFNRDGWQDALIVPHYQGPARLYRNDRGRFRRVPRRSFPAPTRDRHDCDWADVNRDGRPDAYCSVGGARGFARNPNELWMQRANGSFVDQAGIFRVRDLSGRGRDVTFIDANGDPWPDLFVGNDFPRRDGFKSKNKLFINVRGERFRNGLRFGLNRRVGGARVQAVDYNGDGREDLLVCGKRRLYLYENVQERRFRDISRRALTGRGCKAALLGKMNGGPRLDLVRVTSKSLFVQHQRPNGRFRPHSVRVRLQNGGDLALGRVNGDALDDIYVLQRGPRNRDRSDRMLLNQRNGRRLARLRIPQTQRGKGDRVVPIDHDRNGRTDFIVLNGRNKARGPIRLVAFR